MPPARQVRGVTGEGLRYLAASAAAFALDFGLYVALIRVGAVHYLVAGLIGFAAGLCLIYLFSVRWVFRERRHADTRLEFAIFSLIGLAGMALNELILYAGVEALSLSFQSAKIASAALVFCFNFGARKLLLFTRR